MSGRVTIVDDKKRRGANPRLRPATGRVLRRLVHGAGRIGKDPGGQKDQQLLFARAAIGAFEQITNERRIPKQRHLIGRVGDRFFVNTAEHYSVTIVGDDLRGDVSRVHYGAAILKAGNRILGHAAGDSRRAGHS